MAHAIRKVSNTAKRAPYSRRGFSNTLRRNMAYIIHNLEQRTTEWHAFRKDKITASMIPAIMGESKFETALELYHRILNGTEIETTSSMEEGTRIEKEALEWFNFGKEIPFKDAVISYVENPEFMASLDGFNGSIHCEIKRSNKEDHRLCKEKMMPIHYKGQFQWSMYLLDRIVGWYISWMPNDPIAFQVPVDWEYQERMISAVNDFKRRLIELDPPPATDRDRKVIVDPESIQEANRYYSICEQIEILEKVKQDIKNSLLLKHSVKNCQVAKVVINSSSRSWIDYDSIPELKGVDLEKYRKESDSVWNIRRIKTS